MTIMEAASLKICIQDFGTEKLHLGCGIKKLSGWLNVDVLEHPSVDVRCDIAKLELSQESVVEIYACHVLEHFESNAAQLLLMKCWHWLKPGGKICIAVPDFSAVATHYAQNNSLAELKGLILGGGKDRFDIHRTVYDFATLSESLSRAGFTGCERYDWREHDVGKLGIDDFSQAYLPHMDKDNGTLMSLNVQAFK